MVAKYTYIYIYIYLEIKFACNVAWTGIHIKKVLDSGRKKVYRCYQNSESVWVTRFDNKLDLSKMFIIFAFSIIIYSWQKQLLYSGYKLNLVKV